MPKGSAKILKDAIVPAEIARERAWQDFILSGREPNIGPVVLASWLRSRDLFQIDSALKRSPVVLSEEESQRRGERLEPLRLGLTFLEQITQGLRDTDHMLALCDAEGYVLRTIGDSRIIDELADINFRVGGNWDERATGTNGVGTALTARHTVQIIGAEHYVEAWQRWVCTAAPIRDPLSGEIIAILDVTGYKEGAQPHTLLAVYSTATLIEQRLLLELTIQEKILVEALLERSRRFPNDAIFAVDRRGRPVRLNAAAEQLFAAHPRFDGQTVFDELKPFLKAAFEYEDKHFEEHEQVLNSRSLGRAVRTITSLVLRNNHPIGAIIVLPGAGTGRRSHGNDYATAGLDVNRRATSARYSFEDIAAVSTRMAEAIALCRTIADSDLPVLVLGESGTGKEMIAQSIHNASRRSGAPFVAVNCASIPDGLIDAEFFGYEEGAFTGARRGGSVGRFEQANRGTIFLDEVSELPQQAQAALLRVLQEKEVLRVGAGNPTRVDVRVIAATNRELSSELDARRFRSDLFYRLNGISITLPPLRERPGDVAILASRFLDELPGRERPRLSDSALQMLAAYRWPGNVRELRNVIHRAALVTNGPFITVADLPAELRGKAENRPDPADASQSEHLERQRILAMLAECNGNVAEAARRLGISRMTMHRKIRKWSISRFEVLNIASDRN